MEKWEIWPPLLQKPLNRSSPKFVWVITSVTPISTQNFITIRLPHFASPHMRTCAQGDSTIFFGFSLALQPRPLHRFLRSYVKWRLFAQGCAFWGLETKFYISIPFSSKKRKFWATFRRDGKFRLKEALTTLNRHLSPTKVLYWIGKSGSGNSNMGSSATPYLQVTWPSQILDQKSAKTVITMAMLIAIFFLLMLPFRYICQL